MHEDVELVLRVEHGRATQLKRPLAALVLMRPDLPAVLSEDLRIQAATTIANCTRVYDAAGMITDREILVVLPECDASGARLVADRMRVDLAIRNDGRRCWIVMEFPDVERYASPERLLESARRVARPAA